MIPKIETERCVLRGMTGADFDRFADIWAQPEVYRFISATARTRTESWAAMLRYAGSWPLLGYGQWVIVERESGLMLGHPGFMLAMRGLGADFDAAPECAWVLAREAQGRGIGPEVVRAVHSWADTTGLGRSHVIIEAAHAGSIAVGARWATAASARRTMAARRWS